MDDMLVRHRGRGGSMYPTRKTKRRPKRYGR